jgi:hypothetical protein
MRGSPARTLTFVAIAFLVVGTACSETGVGHGNFTVSPPPAPSESVSPSPAPSESASPGPASPLSAGVATLILSGGLSSTVPMNQLVLPAVWAPPPGSMDLIWRGSGPAELRLTGAAFVSQARTSADRTLGFTVGTPDGPLVFTSANGECSVTITPALPDNVGGVFSCSALTDGGGVTTVAARGVFSATS